MEFGERVKEAREEAGMTVHEVTMETGIHSQSLYSYERGRSSPPTGKLGNLAEALGVTTDWLVYGD